MISQRDWCTNYENLPMCGTTNRSDGVYCTLLTDLFVKRYRTCAMRDIIHSLMEPIMVETTKISRILLGAFLVLGVTSCATTAHKSKSIDMSSPEAMAKMEQYGKPGADHKVLEPFVGNWTYTVQSWMKPGDKPEQSFGKNQNSWTMDGRFLKQEVSGKWAGQPFKGIGYTGFDKVRGEYQSIWLDNMMTGMMTASGNYNPATKTITQTGEFSCPITGDKNMWYRSELTMIDNDHHKYSAFGKDEKGKEFKTMEISYQRVK